MALEHYTIQHGGCDWSKLLEPWAQLLPVEFEIWMVNCFGDVFLVSADESVHLLRLEDAECLKLAASREEFAQLAGVDGNDRDWFLIPLVDELAKSLPLPRGYCYGFVQLPILGGNYVASNVRTFPLAEIYGFTASIHQQLKGLPDGKRVRIVVEGA